MSSPTEEKRQRMVHPLDPFIRWGMIFERETMKPSERALHACILGQARRLRFQGIFGGIAHELTFATNDENGVANG